MLEGKPQSLLDAAFGSAFAPAFRDGVFERLVPGFQRPSIGPCSLDDVLVSPLTPEPRTGAYVLIHVTEAPDGTGLRFDWERAPGDITTLQVPWSGLTNMNAPDEADPLASSLARIRAKSLWQAVTDRFEQRIQSGEVQLLGRRGSPLTEPAPLPREAAPHISVVDWISGVATVAGERQFALQVVAEIDPEAAYIQDLKNFKRPRERAKRIIKKLYPAGVPDRAALLDDTFLNSVLQEYKTRNISPPSDSTLLRAGGRKA